MDVRARWLAIAVVAVGCGAPSGDPSGDDAGDSTGAAPLEIPAPAFTEPASDQLTIPVDRTQDVVLGVTGILPGTTRLLVDGVNRGPLPASDPFATLTADSFTLRLRGAMLEGSHTIQLVNDGAEDPLVSREIAVELQATPGGELIYDPGDAALDAFGVTVSGFGPDAVLLVQHQLAPAAPWVHVVPAAGGRWAYDQARTIPIFGYQRAANEGSLAIAAELVRDDTGAPSRLRLAWRVGDPGTAIALVDTAWEDADASTAHVIAFDLDDPDLDPSVLGPHEYAELGRPALVGDRLVAEVFAATDIEQPHPGDHALLTAGLSGAPAEVGPIGRVELGARVDLDRLGRALDPGLAAVGGTTPLAARLDGVQPVVLVPDPEHGRLELRPGWVDDFDLALTHVTGPVTTIVGSFGARTVVAFDRDDMRPLSILRMQDWGQGRPQTLAPTETLPPGATADPAVGILDGHPIFIVPYGSATTLRALRPLQGKLVVDRIDASCTQVALAVDPGATPGTPLSLACVTGNKVYDATLAAEIVE